MNRYKSCFNAVKQDPRLQLLFSGLFVIVLLAIGIPLGDTIFSAITGARSWFQATIPWSCLVYCLIFVAWVSLFLPFVPLCIAIGFIYGIALGLAVQIAASTIGSTCSFLIGRHFLRSWVLKRIRSYQKLRRLERVVSDRWTAIKFNLLMCFGPFPFAVHVYFFAITEMPLWAFVVSFFIGMLPHTCLNILIGRSLYHFAHSRSKGSDASTDTEANTYEYIGLALGLAGCIAFISFMAWLVKKELGKLSKVDYEEDEEEAYYKGHDRDDDDDVDDDDDDDVDGLKNEQKQSLIQNEETGDQDL